MCPGWVLRRPKQFLEELLERLVKLMNGGNNQEMELVTQVIINLQSTLYALCSTLYALCSMLYALCSMLYALRSMLYALYSTLYAIRSMLYALRSMLYALCFYLTKYWIIHIEN